MELLRFLPSTKIKFKTFNEYKSKTTIIESTTAVIYSSFVCITSGAIEVRESDSSLVAFSSKFERCTNSAGAGAITFHHYGSAYVYLSKICYSEVDGSNAKIVNALAADEMNFVDENSFVLCGWKNVIYNLICMFNCPSDFILSNVSKCTTLRATGPVFDLSNAALLRYSIFDNNTQQSCVVLFRNSEGTSFRCIFSNNPQTLMGAVDSGIVSVVTKCKARIKSCDFLKNDGFIFHCSDECSLNCENCYFEGCESTSTGVSIIITKNKDKPNKLLYKIAAGCFFKPSKNPKNLIEMKIVSIFFFQAFLS